MPRKIDNAFTRSASVGSPAPSNARGHDGQRDGAAPNAANSKGNGEIDGGEKQDAGRPVFQPLRATLVRLDDPSRVAGSDWSDVNDSAPPRWSLQLSPMRLVDALPSWCGCGVHDHAVTMVLNATLADGNRRTGVTTLLELCSEVLGSVKRDARRGEPGGSPDDVFMAVDDGCVVIPGDDALLRLALDGRLVGATLVRVHGATELGDARAIRNALRAGRPAWEADFRAASVLEVVADRALALVTESEALALVLVGDNLRQYLAAVAEQDLDVVGWPEPEQIHRLLSVSGSILVRPIETDAFSTFVDVGICTSAEEDVPAAQSLIYDIPSGGWHDER